MEQKASTVEEYILSFPAGIQDILHHIRRLIKEQAPEAVESMAYGMPAYKTYKKPLVYFAAYPHHIGLYATPSGHAQFARELARYKQGKGSVQFPLNELLPFELIADMIQFRVAENKARYGT